MGKISQEKRMRRYFKIFEQIFHQPTLSLYDLSETTHISRNTVSRYLHDMYDEGMLKGPQIKLIPTTNYREYVYLLRFKNPFQVFEGLRGFPHILYHAMTFGDWNIMAITDRLLDFSQLVGFESVVRQGKRGYTYTPKVQHLTWEQAVKKADTYVLDFSSQREESASRRIGPPLTWGRKEWALYHAFKMNIRKKATPILRKLKIRYETYSRWMETLQVHATVHVGYYPDGYEKYLSYCFLLSSDYEESVHTIFSFLPSTPYIIEYGSHLLVFANVISSKISRNLFCTLYDMKRKGIIKGCNQAIVVFHCVH